MSSPIARPNPSAQSQSGASFWQDIVFAPITNGPLTQLQAQLDRTFMTFHLYHGLPRRGYVIDPAGQSVVVDLDRRVSVTKRGSALLGAWPSGLSHLSGSLLEAEVHPDGAIRPLDILRYRNQDLRARPLYQRLELLDQFLAELPIGHWVRPPSRLDSGLRVELRVGPWPFDDLGFSAKARLLGRDLRAGYLDAVRSSYDLQGFARRSLALAGGPEAVAGAVWRHRLFRPWSRVGA
jgi:hypothetical protein